MFGPKISRIGCLLLIALLFSTSCFQNGCYASEKHCNDQSTGVLLAFRAMAGNTSHPRCVGALTRPAAFSVAAPGNRLNKATPAAPPPADSGACVPFSLFPPFVLVEGSIGTVYHQQIRSSARAPSLQFTVAKGRLPDGLHLDGSGRITGTPKRAGQYRFTVQAWTNCPTHANRSEKTYAITIRVPTISVTSKTVPESIRASAGRDTVHAVRYLLNSTSPKRIQLHSSGGQFLANGRIVGRTVQPMTVTIKGKAAWISEFLTVRSDVMAAALRSGFREIIYQRSFIAGEDAVKVQTRLDITILPARAGQDHLPPASGDQSGRTVLPGQIVVTAENSPGGRHAIDQLAKIFPLKRIELFELRTLKKLVAVFTTKADVSELIEQVRQVKGIISAQPNQLFQTFADPRDDLQHIYKQLNLTALHKDYQGSGTKVAIIDTGVDIHHPDLKERVIRHANLIRNNPFRAEIHGTAVAGVMAASINAFGISGIAPKADLFALRACWQTSEAHPEGRCTSVSVSKALDMAIESEVQVVNMSFGTAAPDRLMMQLLEIGAKKSIVFVAPVGNRSSAATVPFPASHPKVLAVGGMDARGGFYPNKTLAGSADLCAPSSHILTTVPGGGHNFMDGTSFSAAIVSGILAVAKEKNRHLGIDSLPDYDGDLCRWQEALMHRSLCECSP